MLTPEEFRHNDPCGPSNDPWTLERWQRQPDFPLLLLPGGMDHTGFLLLPTDPPHPPVTTKLTPGLFRPLLALHKAMVQDAHLIWPARGWRRVETLVDLIAGLDKALLPTQPSAARAAISRAKRRVREAAEEQGFPPESVAFPVEHQTQLGVRLATTRLIVIVGRYPQAA